MESGRRSSFRISGRLCDCRARAGSPFTSLLIKKREAEGEGEKNHNGLSTNITRSSFCGGTGGQKGEEEEGRGDGSLSLELPDENARSDDGVHVKSESIGQDMEAATQCMVSPLGVEIIWMVGPQETCHGLAVVL